MSISPLSIHETCQSELARLRQELSLAEEGLANYAQEVQELRDVLQALCDYQNGPPLPKYRDGWQRAYDQARALLRPSAGHPKGNPP